MSKILIYDIAAQIGGALSILEEYYRKAQGDPDDTYVFITSVSHLNSEKDIEVLDFPWAKKSWLHRWAFEHFTLPKLVGSIHPDEFLSLQNSFPAAIGRSSAFKKSIYLHNPLPKALTEERFGFFDSKNLWLRQNLVGPLIERSLVQADRVIVQTEWMKKRCVENLGIDSNLMEISRPKSWSGKEVPHRFVLDQEIHFLYPASTVSFKNHELLFESLALMMSVEECPFFLDLTFSEADGRRAKKLMRQAVSKGIPVHFIGWQNKDELDKRYQKSILVFPSLLETFGLPLIEAQQYGAPILAADLAYAHETLGAYEKVIFFDPHDPVSLAESIKKAISAWG